MVKNTGLELSSKLIFHKNKFVPQTTKELYYFKINRNNVSEEIKQVVDYIERIQKYETRTFRNFGALSGIVWGFLLFFAGVMDYYAYKINDIFFYFIPWLIASIEGSLFMFFVVKGVQKTFGTPETRYRRNVKISTFIVSLIWIGVLILTIVQMFFLIIPYVTIMVGLITLSNARLPTHDKQRQSLMTGMFLIVVGLLQFILFVFTGTKYMQFFGLISGVSMGVSYTALGLFIILSQD